jgi:predicted MFS family arabinose efflux permease
VKKQESTIFTRDFISLFFAALLIWTNMNLVMAVIPLFMAERLGSSLTEIGVILSVSNLGTLFLRPFLGVIVDRGNRRLILKISLLIMILTSFSYIFVSAPIYIGIIRFFQGIPFAAVTTVLGAVAADQIPESRRGEGLSYFTLTNTLAIAMGPMLGIALYKSGWYGFPFLVTGISGIASFFLIQIINIPEIKQAKFHFNLSNLIDPNLYWILGAGILIFMGVPGIMTYSSLYSKALGVANISLAYSVYGVGLIMTRLFSAKALDKFGAIKVGAVSIVFLVIGFSLIGFWKVHNGLLAGSILLAAGIGMITPTLFTMAVDLADPQRRGSSTALVYSGFDIGGTIGSLLFGRFADIFGEYSTPYLFFGLVELLAFIFFYRFTALHYLRNKNGLIQIQDSIS